MFGRYHHLLLLLNWRGCRPRARSGPTEGVSLEGGQLKSKNRLMKSGISALAREKCLLSAIHIDGTSSHPLHSPPHLGGLSYFLGLGEQEPHCSLDFATVQKTFQGWRTDWSWPGLILAKYPEQHCPGQDVGDGIGSVHHSLFRRDFHGGPRHQEKGTTLERI